MPDGVGSGTLLQQIERSAYGWRRGGPDRRRARRPFPASSGRARGGGFHGPGRAPRPHGPSRVQPAHSRITTRPRTPSRPRSWCWPGMRARFATGSRWRAGFSASRAGPRRRFAWPRPDGAGKSKTAMRGGSELKPPDCRTYRKPFSTFMPRSIGCRRSTGSRSCSATSRA